MTRIEEAIWTSFSEYILLVKHPCSGGGEQPRGVVQIRCYIPTDSLRWTRKLAARGHRDGCRREELIYGILEARYSRITQLIMCTVGL